MLLLSAQVINTGTATTLTSSGRGLRRCACWPRRWPPARSWPRGTCDRPGIAPRKCECTWGPKQVCRGGVKCFVGLWDCGVKGWVDQHTRRCPRANSSGPIKQQARPCLPPVYFPVPLFRLAPCAHSSSSGAVSWRPWMRFASRWGPNTRRMYLHGKGNGNNTKQKQQGKQNKSSAK